MRSFRVTSGLSQESLAERSGLSTRAVSDIETGVARSPRLVTLMLLADALGLSEGDRARLRDAAGADAKRVFATPLREIPLEGREADVAHLRALLARDDVQLVTLVGPAGVGKTALAVNVAIQSAQSFDEGAAMVELAAIREPSLVPGVIANVLTAHSRERSLLLVLDNLEHLTPAAASIDALLAASPRLKVLATSREALRLAREHRCAVAPLERDAAIRLFVRRAKTLKPDFEATQVNAAALATIVEHLEGLPLAIELAAPRLSLLPPQALAARLERRLPLLGGGAIDRPARQQTMHGAIAWSYDLLTPDEQRLFRRCSVLVGGGSLDAAAAVAGDDAAGRSIRARLAPLAEKNLLSFVEAPVAQPRIAMLEMLREFARDRLAESGELDEAQRAHAHYVLRGVELEDRNIAAALEWAASSGEVELGLQIVAAVWRFWLQRRHCAQGLDWIARFLAPGAAAPAVLYAKAVLHAALGDLDEAMTSSEQAAALQRAIGDDAGLAASLAAFGIVVRVRGELDRAETAQAESLEISKRIGDDSGVATALSSLAALARDRGDLNRAASLAEESASIEQIGLVALHRNEYDRAEQLFDEALALARADGDDANVRDALANLAAVARRRGTYGVALARYRETLDLLRAETNKAALARTLEGYATTLAATGDSPRAARLLGAADTLRRAIGAPILPAERAEYDAEVTALRAGLGDDDYRVQWRIGVSMSLERALDESLGR